jgi:hypothetical protein
VKQELCKAFCDSVSVTELPCGFGISTTLFEIEGDPAGLYAIGPDSTGHWKLEDAGRLLPSLIASGYDLASENRKKALASILETADAAFDEDGLEISTGPISKSDIPAHAIRLIVALVRVSDLVQMTADRVRSTFKEDVRMALAASLPSDVEIHENAPADDQSADLRADLVLRQSGRAPVALYLAQNDLSLVEAMLLRSETQGAGETRPLVTALLERENAVSKHTRTRAMNRLDSVGVYEGDERQALAKVVQFVSNAPKVAA